MAETLVSTGSPFATLPANYVRPAAERPRLADVVKAPVPIIDLRCPSRAEIIRRVGQACLEFGCFQVINHGMDEETIKNMMNISREFFHLPVEEKMKYYSEDTTKKVRLSTSSNVTKERVHNWRDYLRLHCHPLVEFVHAWPSSPSSFKEVVSGYCSEVRQLGFTLLELISESLGLDAEYMAKAQGEQGQHMAINYYPPCPEPELTYGLPDHTDPNTITILLQDPEVAGLQVYVDGRWMAVEPIPNALVVNAGDQMQALSNGRYKSMRHRAIVNSNKERLSVATFLCPAYNAVIGPPKHETNGLCSTPFYREFTYAEYYEKFWSRNLDDAHCLELFKRVA